MKPNEETTRSLTTSQMSEQESVKKGKYYLFVIGIDQYEHFKPLNNAVKDAEDFVNLLCAQYQFDRDHLYFLKNEEASRQSIIKEFDKLHDVLEEEDSIVIFYSGHGHLNEERGRGYWIPVNASMDNASEYISNSEVRDFMADLKARHALLIADSCYSATLFDSGELRSDAAMDELEKKASRWAICSGNGPVSDGKSMENSPFMHSILEVLQENTSGKLNTSKILDGVRDLTFTEEKDSLPEGGHMIGNKGGQFIFHKTDTEESYWKLCCQQNNVEGYQAYLEKHPDGCYCQEAQSKLDEISLWTQITGNRGINPLLAYMEKYPKGLHLDDARSSLQSFINQVLKMPEEVLSEVRLKVVEIESIFQEVPKNLSIYEEIEKESTRLKNKETFFEFQESFSTYKGLLTGSSEYSIKAVRFLNQKLKEWTIPIGPTNDVNEESTLSKMDSFINKIVELPKFGEIGKEKIKPLVDKKEAIPPKAVKESNSIVKIESEPPQNEIDSGLNSSTEKSTTSQQIKSQCSLANEKETTNQVIISDIIPSIKLDKKETSTQEPIPSMATPLEEDAVKEDRSPTISKDAPKESSMEKGQENQDGNTNKPKLYALLIAINEYHPQSGVGGLNGCINDMQSVQEFIEKNYKDLDPKIETLINEQATRKHVIETFRSHLVAKPKVGDTVFFYYAGHGSYTPTAPPFKKFDSLDNDETLVCYDSRLDGNYDLTDKEMAVLLSEVAEGVHTLVIADSCHSASVTRSGINEKNIKESLASEFILGKKRFTTGGTSNRTIDSYLLSTNNVYVQQGVDLQIPKSKHLLMSGCSRDEVAMETADNRGLFTSCLLKALNQNINISYADLFSKVRSMVNGIADNQMPTLAPMFGFNPNTVFLRPDTVPNSKRHQIKWDGTHWKMEYGAIYGLPSKPQEVKEIIIGVYDQLKESTLQVGTCTIEKVLLNETILKEIDFLDQEKSYWGEIQSLPQAMPINLLGDEVLVDKVLELYNQLEKPSPNITLIRNFDPAMYLLKADEKGMQILDTASGNLVHGIQEVDLETLEYIIDVLDKLAIWNRMESLQNENSRLTEDTIDFEFILDNSPNNPIKDSIVTLGYPKVGEDKDANGDLKANYFKLNIKNTIDKKLYLAVIHLGPHYEIGALYGCEEIKREETWLEAVSAGFVISNPQEHEATDVFKIIASTDPFDVYKFQQDEIAYGQIITKNQLADRSQTTRSLVSRMPPKADWYTRTIKVNTLRNQSNINTHSVQLAGIKIEGHEAFKADIAFASAKSSRSIHPISKLNSLVQGQNLQLLNLTEQESRGVQDQSIIELSGIENEGSLAESPLIINIDAALSKDGSLVPVTMKDGFVIPLGLSISQEDGSTKVMINHIPEGTDAPPSAQGKRSLGRALWFSFLKLSNIKNDNYNLRKVVYENGVPTYHGLEKKEIVENSKVLMVIHGIIGNTKGMLKNLEFLLKEERYDHIIAFDYENLNTPIEDIAKYLNDALDNVGITPKDNINFDIIAHSMGGLVSRYFIEHVRKNEAIVDNLYMFGTPNGGSVFGELAVYQEKLVQLLTIGLNFGKSWLGPVGAVLNVVNLGLKESTKLTVSLKQMRANSEFIKKLQQGEKGSTKYAVIAGNICDYTTINDSRFVQLMEKILLKTGNIANVDEPNDIAVMVKDIVAIPAILEASTSEVCCHHMNYFEDGEGLDKLKEVIRK